mmetsp:Transcript_10212/g.35265  ORF Transcript_10212/g.35265 Transcript_10212/m.35265 type:complete len:179 (+) Transcript_10212:233-769(+)
MGTCGSKNGKVRSDNYREMVGFDKDVTARDGPGTVAFLAKYECSFTAAEMLGSGAYSTVYRCVDKDSQEECAAKVIKLREMAADEVEALHIEVGILERIRHPNVLNLRNFYEDPRTSNNQAPKAYIVTEILNGGELFDRIVQRTYYSEHEARKVIQILLDVICHLHSKNIVSPWRTPP